METGLRSQRLSAGDRHRLDDPRAVDLGVQSVDCPTGRRLTEERKYRMYRSSHGRHGQRSCDREREPSVMRPGLADRCRVCGEQR